MARGFYGYDTTARRRSVTSDEVLAVIRADPGATVSSIAEELGADTMPVGNKLAYLFRKGRICKAGMKKNAHKWFAVEDDSPTPEERT